MSSRYSLWLEKYKKNKQVILGNLKNCKRGIEEIKATISQEKELILPLPNGKEKREKSCFVDGGEGVEELLGGVIYFIRASGLLWEELEGDEVNQDFLRSIDLGILKYDDYTKERVEFLRSGMEFDVAMKCIEKFSPQYLFLDGSLHVNSTQGKIPGQEYEAYRKKFSRLLKVVKAEGVTLCGISEDSNSRLLLKHLSEKYTLKFPSFMTDCSVLRMLAGNQKFMTNTFFPNSGITSQKFSTLYLQPTHLSTPLRIDAPSWEEDNLTEIISFITKLSKGSKNYGYPLPLYLVHLDAKIEKKHAQWNTRQIIHHIFKDDPILYDAMLREKRRNIRPRG